MSIEQRAAERLQDILDISLIEPTSVVYDRLGIEEVEQLRLEGEERIRNFNYRERTYYTNASREAVQVRRAAEQEARRAREEEQQRARLAALAERREKHRQRIERASAAHPELSYTQILELLGRVPEGTFERD